MQVFLLCILFLLGFMVHSQFVHAATKPTCSVSASPQTIPYGTATTISWSASGGSAFGLTGIPNVSGVSQSGSAATPILYSSTTYTFTVNLTSDCVKSVTVTVEPPAKPTCSMSTDTNPVAPNTSFNISWSSAGGTSATLNGIATYTFGSNAKSISSDTTFTLVVSGPGGSCTAAVTVKVASSNTVSCTFTANGADVASIILGNSATLEWHGTGGSTYGISNNPGPDIGAVAASGTKVIPASALNKLQAYNYTFTVDLDSKCTKNVIIRVTATACPHNPVIGYAVTDSNGQTPTAQAGDTSISLIYWTSVKVCMTGGNDTPVSEKSGLLSSPTAGVSGIGGTTLTVGVSSWTDGSTYVQTKAFGYAPPGGFKAGQTYHIQINNQDINHFTPGQHVCIANAELGDIGGFNYSRCSPIVTEITITIPGQQTPPPTCTLTAAPSSIVGDTNENSTLTWSSTGGTSWGMSPDIGTIGASGSRSVHPTATTDYIFVVVGPGGSKTCTVRVTVRVPAPSCSIVPSLSNISLGQSVRISWSVTGATKVTFDGESVGVNDSRTVSPPATTSYALVATGAGGVSTTCTSTVVVGNPNEHYDPPTCSISPSSVTVDFGETVNLIWATTGATAAILRDTSTGSEIPVSVNSSGHPVTPIGNTVYEFIASGPGGQSPICRSTITVKGSESSLTCQVLSPTVGNVNESVSKHIFLGENALLRWKVAAGTLGLHAYDNDGVELANAIGETSPGATVAPTQTKTYYLARSPQEYVANRNCIITVYVEVPSNKPYIKIDGADVYSGAAFGSHQCVPTLAARSAAISTNGYLDTKGSSASQYGTFASGLIGGVGAYNTFLGNNGYIRSGYKDLLFANDKSISTGATGLYYGSSPDTVTDLPCVNLEQTQASAKPLVGTAAEFVSTGVGVGKTPVAGDITLDSLSVSGQKTLIVNGNVTITGNLTYATSYTNPVTIPYLKIIAKNIYVKQASTQIDGHLVAYPTDIPGGTVADGILDTCSDIVGPGIWPEGASANFTVASCARKLTVNGSVVARRILWKGTKGTVGDLRSVVDPGCLYSTLDPNNCAAELVNFSPEAYISQFGANPHAQFYNTPVSTLELPPIY